MGEVVGMLKSRIDQSVRVRSDAPKCVSDITKVNRHVKSAERYPSG